MTNQAFIKEVSEATGYTIKSVSPVVQAVFDVLKEHVAQDGEFRWTGFGRFTAELKESRNYRHPATGEIITAPAKRLIKFHPHTQFKEYVNAFNKQD